MPSQSLFTIQKYVAVCESTNSYLKHILESGKQSKNVFLRTDYQLNGRGQGENIWESKAGKNLLISFAFGPINLPVVKQFYLSKWVAVSLIKLLTNYLDKDKLWIKWPNDIYYESKKIAGVLIENSIMGESIQHSIVGVGLNVNQQKFESDAPNPVSIFQILKREVSVEEISNNFISILNDIGDFSSMVFHEVLDNYYLNKLYWKDEKHLFGIANRNQQAIILGVDDYGFLKLLIDKRVQVFDIKEVIYIS